MKEFWIDSTVAFILFVGLLWWQLQPVSPLDIQLTDPKGQRIEIQPPSIVLFWDMEVKASHRDIQLIQRFHQAHPQIEIQLVHKSTISANSLTEFLTSLGVYTTPRYNSEWPEQIPTTLLFHQNQRLELHHSPHYSQLMEFFEVDH